MNTSFSTKLPLLQLAWDSTSMGLLMECARKYQLSIILGYTPRSESVHLLFGIFYHSALETYDKSRFAGASHAEAQKAAVRRALTDTWNKELKRPWNSDDPNKNRFTLIRTIVWYTEQFANDSISTVVLSGGNPAIELSFRFQTTFVSAITDEPFLVCGHMDKLGRLESKHYVIDRKTTKNQIYEDYFLKFTPDNQMDTYDFSGNVVYNIPTEGIIIDAAQVIVTFSRFQRGIITRTDSQRQEWYDGLGYWFAQAEAHATANYWPMNRKSCNNFGGCPFRPICALPPEARQEWLDRKYVRRIWDPLKVRGDF